MKVSEMKVPTLRFNEFTENYKEYRLSDFLSRYSENNKDEEFGLEDILSLSSKHGIVNRRELLEDTYSKVNHKNYLKTRLNDFVYGKSITASYPYGLFKANNFKDGLLSTLYFTFKVSDNVKSAYLDSYFSHHNRANNFLKKYVLVGDRYITADANYILSGKIYVPKKKEQEKVVKFLSAIDKRIQNLEKKKDLLEQHKKGIVQKIFKQELKFKQDDGKEFLGWEKMKLSEISDRVTRKNKINNLNVLTISAQMGLVNQLKYFNRSVSSKSLKGYYLIQNDDFAYNKSYSTGYPMGAIKRLKNYPKGVVSTLYICFRFNNKVLNSFMEQYFDSGLQNREIKKVAQEGARNHGLLNIGVKDFFDIRVNIPCIEEQQKIADFLSALDQKIILVNQQIENTRTYKKGLLQQMFV